MLPCQKGCHAYCPGCHKSCPHFRAMQEAQRRDLARKRSTYAALMNPAAPCCTNAARRVGIWGRCPIELYSVLCLRYTTIK